MAQKNEIVAAVDIGTTKIVAIVGKKNENGKLEILGMSKVPSQGVKRGVVTNIQEVVGAIQQAVDDVKAKSNVDFNNVFVGIAGQHIRSQKSRGQKYIDVDNDFEITAEDVDVLKEDMFRIPIEAGEEILHVLPQSYVVDNEVGVKNPIGMSGKLLEGNFHIVIGQISSAKNIEKCVNRVGLNINELILEPLASSASVLTDDECEAGVALVDIGGGTTDVAVYYDDIIRHTAVIPFGGNVVSHDIKEGCNILHRYAEMLKVQYGSALGDIAPEDKVVSIPGIAGREPKEISFKTLSYIIQSRMEEIIDAISFEIENSGFKEKLGAGIVLTGGGALLRHLPQLVKYKTGLDVRIGMPSEYLASTTKEEILQPMFSTSVGLLLRGVEYFEHSKKEYLDLANEEKKEEEFELLDEEIREENPNSKRGFFGLVKSTLNEIFEDKGARMDE